MTSTRKLTTKQRKSVELTAEAKLNVWEGSVRSGKTVGSILQWIRFIRTGPDGNLLMIGKTERTLKRNIIDPIVVMLGKKRARYLAGTGEFHVCGRVIYIVGANDETAQEKIRGLTLAGAYGDEISTWPESFWAMLKSRFSIRGAKFFGTTNPDSPSHWLKKDLDRAKIWLTKTGEIIRRHGTTKKGKVLNLARFSFHIRDNIQYLDPEYLRDVMADYVGLWRRRFIEGEWVAAEGSIYEHWDRDTHVVAELPAMRTILSHGIDYGTTNPTAGVEIGLGVDNKLYVMREWVPTRGATDGELSTSYLEWRSQGKPPDLTIVDPSAASLKKQLHLDGIRHLYNGNNDVNDGLRSIASLLAAGHLLVHESCELLIEEIEGYVWDPKPTEKGLDAPLKENDHWCDAMRYGIYTARSRWRWIMDRRMTNAA